MRAFATLAILFLVGCGGSAVTQQKEGPSQVIVVVKDKRTEILTQADWHNQFRQQAVIIDKDDNEYRFNIGTDLTQYNLLMKGKKYILYSYRGYGYLTKVEEIP